VFNIQLLATLLHHRNIKTDQIRENNCGLKKIRCIYIWPIAAYRKYCNMLAEILQKVY